ncbi:MAG TPA: hypothetical protein EYI82_06080 [Gammaproteobacteria bacterium]|nr:hypothetical protein [Gammaproteobacteria bacterium]
MDKDVKQRPNKGLLALLATLFILSNNAFARTQVIDANIDSVEPIYMNYKIEKLIKPCQSMTIGCWNVSYQKRALKSLQGYRVKLSFEGQQFTARMREKPSGEHLKIRVSKDLLGQPSKLAMNATIAY